MLIPLSQSVASANTMLVDKKAFYALRSPSSADQTFKIKTKIKMSDCRSLLPTIPHWARVVVYV
jgi:hypothetical protein